MSKRRRNKTNTSVSARLDSGSQKSTKATSEDPEKKPKREYHGVAKRRDIALAFKAERVGAIAPAGHEEDEDPFYGHYKSCQDLVEPLIPFEWCWRQYYQCDTFAICADVIADNVVNPYQFYFSGDKQDKNSDENKAILTELEDFFSRVNEKGSWLRVAKKVMRSLEIVNVAFVEVIRGARLGQDTDGKWEVSKEPPERLYYIPSPHMRATELGKEEIPVTIIMPRRGQMYPITIYRKFRRFARINPTTRELTWFKELGDPRILDAKTGAFLPYSIDSVGKVINSGKTSSPATEIWFFRYNTEGQIYGIPMWFSVFWDMRSRNEAKWINYDHLDQGAIPPGMLTISGGALTEKSKEALDSFLEELRSSQFYNRIPYLEVQPEMSLDLNAGSSGRIPEIKWVKLRDPQHEDFMFEKHLGATAQAIRQRRRIPPVLMGIADETTYASAYTAMEVAESQVFQPLRGDFDEKITVDLIQNEFGFYRWSIRTGGSKIGDKETFYRAVGALSRAGALTINDVRELANQLLGTSFAPFEGELYNEPLTIVSSLAQLGMVGFDEGSKALVFMQAVQVMATAATGAGEGFEKAASGSIAPSEARKAAEEMTQALVDKLTELAELNYTAPTIEEMQFELLPIAEKVHPHEGEGQTEFMDRCIPVLIEEGKDQSQAAAICSSMWEAARKAS